MRRARYGPIPGSSVSERSSIRIAVTSSGQVNARRDALRNAFATKCDSFSDSNASNSASCALLKGFLLRALAIGRFWTRGFMQQPNPLLGIGDIGEALTPQAIRRLIIRAKTHWIGAWMLHRLIPTLFKTTKIDA